MRHEDQLESFSTDVAHFHQARLWVPRTPTLCLHTNINAARGQQEEGDASRLFRQMLHERLAQNPSQETGLRPASFNLDLLFEVYAMWQPSYCL